MSTDQNDRPEWTGVNHLALVTDDMDATTRFWHGVLGAPLVATVGTNTFKHYFFRVGEAQTIAFFEYTGVELDHWSKPAGIPFPQASQFDHLSLNLPDEEALEHLRARLIDHDCEVTEVVDHGIVRSIYFSDPSGIALEASYWTTDIAADTYDAADRFHDAEPVAAVRELVADGALASTPRTHLVDGIVTD
jgi:catechol 2,3-dioxygenase-like lactoylglutathione lyase family enzyme